MFGKRSLRQGKAKAKSKGKDSPKSPPVICTTPAEARSIVRVIKIDPVREIDCRLRNNRPGTWKITCRPNASFGFRSTHSFAPCFCISSPTGVFRRQGIEALSTMNVWEKKLEARQGKGEKKRKR